MNMTASMRIAINNKHEDLIKVLIELGADPLENYLGIFDELARIRNEKAKDDEGDNEELNGDYDEESDPEPYEDDGWSYEDLHGDGSPPKKELDSYLKDELGF